MRASMRDSEQEGNAAKDRRSAGDSPDEVSATAADHELRTQILEVLEEHRAAGELFLQRHHAALHDALERVCFAIKPIHAAQPAAELPVDHMSNKLGPAVVSGPPGSASSAQEARCFKGSTSDRNEDEPSGTGRFSWLHRSDSASSVATSVFVSTLTNSQGQNKRSASLAPSLRERVGAMIENPLFDSVIGCFIVLNTVAMFVQLEAEVPSQDGGEFIKPDSHVAFGVLAHIFNATFLLELVIRLYVKRCRFFRRAFNWIDLLIVVLTIVDSYILSMLQDSSRQNMSFMHLVRFIRVVRTLRVIRTMNLFRSLRVLINTIAMSFQSLFWSMLILFLFMLMFALFLCQMLSGFILDETNSDHGMKQWAFRFYGSPFRALWTVFEVTFSGGWPNYARPLVENVNPYYAAFFAIYITGVVVATVRIVFAMFLKDTLQSAASDAEMIVAEKMKEMEATTLKLSEMFRKADASGDGYLSAEELQQIMTYPKVKVWMSVLGLDVSDTQLLFRMLDDGNGRISYDGFVNGILRLKGNSRSIDTINIMRDCERISKHCEATRIACEEVLAALSVAGGRAVQEPGQQRQGCPPGAAAVADRPRGEEPSRSAAADDELAV